MGVYKISVHGCDDSTIFEMELTDEEYELVKKIAHKCNDTSFGCMPTMDIGPKGSDSTESARADR